MDIRTTGEVEIRVGAPPASVYSLVSDIGRTGEWSPECRHCRWVDGADGARPGARFRGWNRSGLVRWSRLVEVVAAEPGSAFAFRTLPDRLNRDSTTWSYRFEPDGDGTRLFESYEIPGCRGSRSACCSGCFSATTPTCPHMRQTLEHIKTLAESTQDQRSADERRGRAGLRRG